MAPVAQLTSGVPGLDRVLNGGLRESGTHLIVGQPGTGKTILAHQTATFQTARGSNVLYLTALSESHGTLIQQAKTFSFYDASLVGERFYYASLSGDLERGRLNAVQESIARWIRERDPTLIVLEGVNVFEMAASSDLEFHAFLNNIQGLSAVSSTTIILLATPFDRRSFDPALTHVDAILRLSTHEDGPRRVRRIEVVKMRGVDHLTGEHTMIIDHSGIRIYPRLESLVSAHTAIGQMADGARYGTGTPGIDAMLGGGVPPSSVTLVPGVIGAGKTLCALGFVAAGEEPGLFIGFHEAPNQLMDMADGVGLPLRPAVESGRVQLDWQPSAEFEADALAACILDAVREHKVRRVAIDGLDDLLVGLAYTKRSVRFLNAFMNLLRAQGTAVFLTQELRQVFGSDLTLPLGEVSAAVDNILLLRYTEARSDLHRYISIIKMRGQGYDSAIREFVITGDGIDVGQRMDALDDGKHCYLPGESGS